MKMTLLEMVQNILSSVESDEVDSIFDTAEALQVAEVIKETYYQLVSNQVIPEHKTIAQLTSAGATAKVFMKIPDTVHKVGGPGCRCHDHADSSPGPHRNGARLAPDRRIGDRSLGRRRRTHPRIWLPGLPGLEHLEHACRRAAGSRAE